MVCVVLVSVCVCVLVRVCVIIPRSKPVSLSPVLAILAEPRESIHGNHVNGSLRAFFMLEYLNSI